jgi:LPXTG-motif cell wall-anchored protein
MHMRSHRSGRFRQFGVVLAICAVGLTTSAASAGAQAGSLRVHGSATVVSACDYFVPPFLLPAHDPLRLAVTVSSDASPQPHDADPITLSNTTVEVRIPADYFQAGVADGIIGDGFTIPATVSATIRGSNTAEATQVLTQSQTVALHVVDGVASPIVITFDAPDTVWHPDSRNLEVVFSEQSVHVGLTLDLPGIGIGSFSSQCPDAPVHPFVALGGMPMEPPPTPPTTTTTTVVVDPPLIAQTTTVPAANALPRTGSSSGYAVFFGLSCIAAGALLIGRSRKSWIR